MDDLRLTAKELLFAASRLGAQTFFGLPDPFWGMDETDIALELTQLQMSLAKKGYASVGFDDAFKLSSDAEELVSVCANCEQYIMADLVSPGGIHKNPLFHVSEGKAVRISEEKGSLTLRPVKSPEISGLIWEEMAWSEDDSISSTQAYSLPYKCIAGAQELAESQPGRAVSLLMSEGCPGQLARILQEGFARKANFCSVSVTDLVGRRFEYFICVRNASGSILLTPMPGAADDCWELRSVSSSELREQLDSLCKLPDLEGGD